MTSLLHLGNIFYLVAYSVRDMMWLRIITVAATLCLIPYYAVREAPLYAPIIWCTLFTLVNVVQIVLLVLQRRPIFLGEEELHLYRTIFRALTPREFGKLLSIAEWKKANVGKMLLEQDEPANELMLIASGQAAVELDGRRVTEVCAGQFVGEMGFLTQQSASARVVAAAQVDYLAWPSSKLRWMLDGAPELHLKFQGVLGSDLVAKLRQGAQSAAHPSLVDALHTAGAE